MKVETGKMGLNIKSLRTEIERQWTQELKFLLSNEGIELQLCLIAQGYKYILAERLIVLFGSGFVALKIIQNLEEEINAI